MGNEKKPRIVEMPKELIGCGIPDDCEDCNYSYQDGIGLLRCGFNER